MSILTQVDFDNRLDYGIDQLNGVSMTQGAGSIGTGNPLYSCSKRTGNFVTTDMFIDLVGLASSAAGEIIAGHESDPCHFGQFKDNIQGIPKMLRIECLEVPATGEPDIAFYIATEATGTEDDPITDLTETVVSDPSIDWTADTVVFADVSAIDFTDEYLYLVAGGGGTAATYTTGKFHLTFISALS